MIKKIIFIYILLNFCFSAVLFPSPEKFNSYFINAAGIAKPSVVNIVIYKKNRHRKGVNYQKVADGSGTIISRDGFIITNYHVVAKGDYYQVIHIDGSKFEVKRLSNGEYFFADLKTDLALLKVENTGIKEFEPIRFADSNKLSEGEWVIAIGNPYGLKQSISCGIVSSKGRNNVGFADIEDFIQTDVSINPGNSGGPLINLYGRMVGINTAIRTVSGSYQGISFSIPSNIVKHVYHELREHGRVRRGWLGFLAKEKKSYRGGERAIVEIISVIKKSPAFMAGLIKGDIIREIDGKSITTLGELIKSIGEKSVGLKINITVSRDGQLFNYKITLREKKVYRKINKGLKTLFSIYGIEIDENAESGDIIISYLSPRSMAFGLKWGDIIVSLNGKKIYSLEDFIRRFYKSGKRISRMKIYRDTKLYIIDFSDKHIK